MAILRCLCVFVLASATFGCTIMRSADDRRDGAVPPDGDVACDDVPVITDVSPRVLAHGARVTVRGGCLAEATSLTLDGAPIAFTLVDDALVIDAVPDDVPVGASIALVASSANADSDAFTVAVAHLVVRELDAETEHGGNNEREFVELSTGVAASLDLAGYAVLFLSGMMPETYDDISAVALGPTSANGYYVIGNDDVGGTEATIANRSLGEGPGAHAVVVAQTSTLPPRGTPIGDLDVRIIDAVVYSVAATSGNMTLLAWCYPSMPARVQLDESSGGDVERDAQRRCGEVRRDGRVFATALPTPGAANGCP